MYMLKSLATAYHLFPRYFRVILHFIYVQVLEEARHAEGCCTHVEEKEAYIVKPTAYGSRTVRVKCCFLQHHFFYRIGMGWGGCNADVPSSCTPAWSHTTCTFLVLAQGAHWQNWEWWDKQESVNVKHAGSSSAFTTRNKNIMFFHMPREINTCRTNPSLRTILQIP